MFERDNGTTNTKRIASIKGINYETISGRGGLTCEEKH